MSNWVLQRWKLLWQGGVGWVAWSGGKGVVFATRIRRRWIRSWAGVRFGCVDDVGNLVRVVGEGAGVTGVNIVCVGSPGSS